MNWKGRKDRKVRNFLFLPALPVIDFSPSCVVADRRLTKQSSSRVSGKSPSPCCCPWMSLGRCVVARGGGVFEPANGLDVDELAQPVRRQLAAVSGVFHSTERESGIRGDHRV